MKARSAAGLRCLLLKGGIIHPSPDVWIGDSEEIRIRRSGAGMPAATTDRLSFDPLHQPQSNFVPPALPCLTFVLLTPSTRAGHGDKVSDTLSKLQSDKRWGD